jgi:hypothetical protein
MPLPIRRILDRQEVSSVPTNNLTRLLANAIALRVTLDEWRRSRRARW